MSAALYTLGRWAFRARGLVALLWAAVLLALVAGAGLLSTGTDNTYSIPGTESQDALDALARTFPEVSGASAQLIAVAPDGESVSDEAFETAVEASVADIANLPQISSATSPYDAEDSPNISADGSAVLVPIQLTVSGTAVLASTSDALQEAGDDLEAALPDGSTVAVGGQLFSQSPTGISVTELLGIAVAFVVLLFTFASLAAAGLPLVTALVGVGASLSLVLLATRFTTVTSTTPLLALMLGLAVGIDYALFILARHQDQLEDGIAPEEAAARSVATSGSAVVFAALTVIIALLGLAVAGIPFLTTMGLAAAVAVAIAVLVSLTLTPALLGFARWHVAPRRFRPSGAAPEGAAPEDEASEGDGPEGAAPEGAAPEDEAPEDQNRPAPRGQSRFFRGWVRLMTAVPVLTVVLIVGALAAAAVPAAHLRLALPDAGSLPEGEPGRVTYDLVAAHFGPGYNGPLLVTGTIIESSDPVGLMNDLGSEIAGLKGVASVPLTTPNTAGDTGIVQVVPEGGPDSVATADLVAELRSRHDHFEREYGVDLAVTGYTAAGIDISARLGGALLPFGLIVVGLSLVLLAMVFRSIVVPVTAALGYVLSIGAAFGLTTLVFVDGFLAGPLGVAAVGGVISFMPIIVMGVLFGLAMDYEVFLVSRMREDFVHRHDARGAVRDGFVAAARVVTAAATIMFAVFVAFVPDGDANIQPIAFGLAVGVVIDAFVVRMSLIPAVLTLFGDAAWRMPRLLDRMLPHFDVEGRGIAVELALAEWPGDDAAVAAQGLRVRDPGAPPIDAHLPGGAVLVLAGGAEDDRRKVLAALSGRGPIAAGTARVAGLVLPTRAGGVRGRTAWWDGRSDDRMLAEALALRPAVLFVDRLDDAPADIRGRVRAALERAFRADPQFAVVIGAADPGEALRAVPDAVPVHVVDLEPAGVGAV